MIIAVTPNPAIDHTVLIDDLTIGSVHGGATGVQVAGGKGLNVARAVRSLGADVIAVGPAGGATGAAIVSLAQAEGIDARFTDIQGSSRICTILTNGSGVSTVVNEVGPEVSAQEWDRFVEDLRTVVTSAQVVTISGSLPPGSAPESLSALAEVCPQDDDHVWIDCYPTWMGEAIDTGRSVKVNHAEAAAGLGRSIPTVGRSAWAVGAAAEIVQRGARQCIVTLGSEGAVWVTPDVVLVGEVPRIDAVNAVGSGDSFLAGIAVAIERGEDPERALALALAAGAANAMERYAGSFDVRVVEELAGSVVVV